MYVRPKKFTVTGLVSPDGKEWAGEQLNLGHTQGIACRGDWLVLTNNQKAGVGYIALCRRNLDGNYKYVGHVKDLDEKELLYSHPGGVQMFNDNNEIWVVVPFEKDDYEMRAGDVLEGLPTHYEESEIRFYRIESDRLECKKTIKRAGRKAGSAGIAKTSDSEKPFVLAVAYENNAVDFYRGSLKNSFEEKPFSTLPYSKERPPYVNAMSLLFDENDLYIVGLTGKWRECSDFLYVSEVDLNNGAVIHDSLSVDLESRLRSDWHGPSFRWGASLSSTGDGKPSFIAAERMIHPEGKTEIAVLPCVSHETQGSKFF